MNLFLFGMLMFVTTVAAIHRGPAPNSVIYPEDDASVHQHFERFKTKHNKKYKNTTHESHRLKNFYFLLISKIKPTLLINLNFKIERNCSPIVLKK